jgi:hypothetical protein
MMQNFYQVVGQVCPTYLLSFLSWIIGGSQTGGQSAHVVLLTKGALGLTAAFAQKKS